MKVSDEAAISHHESGHAVAFLHLGLGFESVEMWAPYQSTGGYARSPGGRILHHGVPTDAAEWGQFIVALFAGPAAEAQIDGITLESALREGGSADLERAHDVVTRMSGNPSTIVDAAKARAKLLVDSHWHEIRRLASSLRLNRVLTEGQCAEVLRLPLRNWRGQSRMSDRNWTFGFGGELSRPRCYLVAPAHVN